MMFLTCCIVVFIPIYLCLQGVAGFFVKHVHTGMCINDTSQIQSKGSWGKLSFVELSNSCLDPAAQFRFRKNGAMLNLKRPGCLDARFKGGAGYHLDMFLLYVDAVSLDRSGCAVRPDLDIYRNMTQTSGGALSVYYKGYGRSSFETWCAVPATYGSLVINHGIDPYIKMTTPCNGNQDQLFHFGSVTCYGNKVENANCPKNQYMVVKTASYRGLPDTKTCGSSDDYTCQVDVTCLLKKKCDGQHECNIIVDDNLSHNRSCSGLSKYLYFEYQCADNVARFKDLCVFDVSLSSSSLPNEGFVQITTDNGNKSVCGKSLKDVKARYTVCRHLGYGKAFSLYKKAVPSEAKHVFFSGSVNCSDGARDLFQCSFTTSNETCSELLYVKCHICSKPTLQEKEGIPDSSFTASASSEDHNASDARISSGSSWCAPLSDVQPYLQIDLRRLYLLDNIAIFGDSTSAKWVTSYSLNYTTDLMTWKQFQFRGHKIFDGPKSASSYAAIQRSDGLRTRAVRFIPLTFVVQPCMRVEMCGITPSAPPRNIKTTSRSTSSLSLIWDVPEKSERDGVIISYTVCISHSENEPCFKTYITSDTEVTVRNLNASTQYYVRVLASRPNKNASSNFSKSEGFFTNGKATGKAIAGTSSTLTFLLEKPSKTFVYFYVVVWKLKDGKEPKSSDNYKNNELVTYGEQEKSTNPLPYIAAVVKPSSLVGNTFILGDDKNTSSDYYNGALQPGTSYRIFQRVFINQKGDYYSTDWSPSSQTNKHKGTNKSSDGSRKYLAAIIVLIILLVISIAILAYVVYRNHLKSSSTKGGKNVRKNTKREKHLQLIDENYEEVEDTYTALNRTGEEEQDDHLYNHLNEAHSDYVNNPVETGV